MPPKATPKAGQLQWILDPSDSCFNLAILGRTKDNALTLRSDFMVGVQPPSQTSWLLFAWCCGWTLRDSGRGFLSVSAFTSLSCRLSIQNHLSGLGMCTVDDRSYQLEMAVFHGDSLETITSSEFLPQGAVAVVTSIDCVNWLQKLLQKLWLPGEGCSPPYRGMPMVILALDEWLNPGIFTLTVCCG